jgi:hypothetical protein
MFEIGTIEIERLDPGCFHTFTVYNRLLSKESFVLLHAPSGNNVMMIVHSIGDGQMDIKIMNVLSDKVFSGLLRFGYEVENEPTIRTANNF